MLNGLTAWGLLITGTVVFGVGSAVATTTLAQAGQDIASPAGGSYWPVFVAYGVGVVVASLGGVIGGVVPRPSSLFHGLDNDHAGDDMDLRDDGFERVSTSAELGRREWSDAGAGIAE